MIFQHSGVGILPFVACPGDIDSKKRLKRIYASFCVIEKVAFVARSAEFVVRGL